jgi:hypothetical protein
MDIDLEFPWKVCLNLERREDRRRRASEMFRMHHLRVERWLGLDGRRFQRTRGWPSVSHRAMTLSLARVIRRAHQRKEKSVLYFEDDVVLHEDFRSQMAALKLPEDWGMFYFGCLHIERPVRIGEGLVRVKEAYATHAVAFRDEYYEEILRGLRPIARQGIHTNSAPADVLLARLHTTIPTYAAYPNLAWQHSEDSDLAASDYKHFSGNGEQLFRREVLANFE